LPPRIRDGGETSIVVQPIDDLSGVKDVTGMLLSPNGKATVGFSARKEGESGNFVGRVGIPKDAEAGSWHVGWVQVSDNANNAKSFTNTAATAPASWRLIVESPDSDSTPPTLKAVWLERPAVEEKGTQIVYVMADDDNSGVASVTGTFQSPSKKALIGFGGQLKSESSTWAGTLTIPAGADCGDWTLLHIRLVDKAGNAATVAASDPLLSRVSFAVSRSGPCDGTPPELESISLVPQVVSNEVQTVIEVTAYVRDEGSGTRGVSGRVEGPRPNVQGSDTPKIYFYCTRTGSDPQAPWTGKITVPRFSASGMWRVTWLQVQDAANNSQGYSMNDPVLANAVFEVR
jgi:hypothetical protein